MTLTCSFFFKFYESLVNFYSFWSEFCCCVNLWAHLLREGVVLNKVYYREAPPQGPTPYPFIYHFGRKGTPFTCIYTVPFIDQKKVPLSHSCTSFRKSCSHFHVVPSRASIWNIIIKGPFKYLNDRFPYPFIYFNLWNPYPFIYLKPENGTPFQAEPPSIILIFIGLEL